VERLSALSAADWGVDIDALTAAVEANHPNPWHGTPRAEFLGRAQELKSKVKRLRPAEVLVGLMRLMACLSYKGRDGHTGLFQIGRASCRERV